MDAKYGQVLTATDFFPSISHSRSKCLDSVFQFSQRRAGTVVDIVHSGWWTVRREKKKKGKVLQKVIVTGVYVHVVNGWQPT